jgi:LTXXQ motif family protein
MTRFRLIGGPVSATMVAVALATASFVNPTRAATSETSTAQAAPAQPMQARPKSDAVESRITELKQRLQITPAQMPQWNAVAQVMRDNAQTIRKLVAERSQNQKSITAIDDLRSYETLTEAHAKGMKKLLPTFQALYNSMSDQQKKNADLVFARFERPGGPKHHVS